MSTRFRRLSGAVLAAMLTLYSAVSHAQVASATVDMFNINFRLLDLDLNDGITPAMTIANNDVGPIHTAYSRYDDGVATPLYDWINTTGTTHIAQPFGSASTTSGADFMRSSASRDAVTPGFHEFSAENFYTGLITLTPSTQLEFSSDFAYTASDPGGNINARSSVELLAYFLESPPGQPEYRIFQYQRGASDATLNDHFDAQLRTGAEGGQVWFKMRVVAAAGYVDISQPPPVPEPATYAMLAAGLGMLGLLRLRVRAHARRRCHAARALVKGHPGGL